MCGHRVSGSFRDPRNNGISSYYSHKNWEACYGSRFTIKGVRKDWAVPGITRDREAVLEEEKSWNSSLPFSTMRMRARSRHSCRCKSWATIVSVSVSGQPATTSASLLVDICVKEIRQPPPKKKSANKNQTTSKIPDEIEIKLQTDIAAATAVLKI